MLRKFAVTNYKNFKDKTELDLTKKGKYAFNSKCITGNCIGKMLIMGRNGCGKTNFGYALFDIVCTLTDKALADLQVDPSSFLCANGDVNCATFEYEFEFDEKIVNYTYKKTSPGTVIFEKLEINDSVAFVFDLEKGTGLTGNLKQIDAGNLNTNRLDGSISALRFIANNTQQNDNSIVRQIVSFVEHMLYFRCLDDRKFIGYMNHSELLEPFIINEGLVDDFEAFIQRFAKLDIKLDVVRNPGMTDYLVQDFGKKKLPFGRIASSGTRSLELFYYWNRRFRGVSFLFIDEFDAFYHFELSESIVKYLIENFTGMQTVLTSHNTDLVSNEIMRPDCYLILSENGLTPLPDLTERELREGHNLEKLLRSGEFQ